MLREGKQQRAAEIATGMQGRQSRRLERLLEFAREQVESRVLRGEVQRGERQGPPEPLGRKPVGGSDGAASEPR